MGDPTAPLAEWMRFHLATLHRPDLGDELLERAAGRPGAVLALSAADLPGLSDGAQALLQSLRDPAWNRAAWAELKRCGRERISILMSGGAGWPGNLEGLPAMPRLLFAQGRLLAADSRAVGVVGSRRPSPHGLRQAERFAGALARLGVTVVSGLARGIDGAAHRGALAAGGRTIAVLGSGLARIYPREHLDLASRISRSGAVLTEFPCEAPPRQFHFPHRNRVLSGLSRAVLVVEAGEKSGSLITAEWAMEQDRPVFALPGRVDSPEARGALRLIQEGASLVIEPEEVAEALGWRTGAAQPAGVRPPAAGSPARPEDDGGDHTRRLPANLATLFAEEDAWHADRIIERLARPPGEVLAELSRLEEEGLLARLPGGAYALGGG